ncbi:MAG: DUF951 domain-containing protein [Clostridiales bacterium]|nr:DUF951 domain-containing protein [Clostridiales bacterium]
MFEINLGDVIITKKNHPCGSNNWECVRTGADIKLKCLNCGRIIMLDREDLKKRIKNIIKADKPNG